MDRRPAGTAATVTVPFVDGDGNAVTPTALSWRVTDEQGSEVLAPAALAVPAGGTSVAVTVPAAVNALPAPYPNQNGPDVQDVVPTKALRVVELTMTTPAGASVASVAYVVTAGDAQALVVLQNSFQPYGQALLTSDGMNLPSWSGASQSDQVRALAEAFVRLTRFGYRVRWPKDPDAQRFLSFPGWQLGDIEPSIWPVMTPERWFTLYPEKFREVMRRAQLVEADAVLTSDPYADKRASGVVQEVIGQSSVTFRVGRPLDLGLDKRTLRELTGYVLLRATLTRR